MGFLDSLFGKPKNKQANLHDLSIATAGNIFKESLSCTRMFKQINNNVLDDKNSFEVISEFEVLFIQIVDRIAFCKLEPSCRNEFIDNIWNHIIEMTINVAFVDLNIEERKNIREYLINNLSEGMLFYGQYKKIFFEENESMDGTLIWEFSKKISEINKSNDISYIMHVATLVHQSLKRLNLESLFDDHL